MPKKQKKKPKGLLAKVNGISKKIPAHVKPRGNVQKKKKNIKAQHTKVLYLTLILHLFYTYFTILSNQK